METSKDMCCFDLKKPVVKGIWLWLKIKEPGLRRFYSLVPFTKGAILVHVFKAQPFPGTVFGGMDAFSHQYKLATQNKQTT